MSLDRVPAGLNVPEDIYVIIEISPKVSCIKYEVNKKLGVLCVDRFLPSTMYYPCHYGYINNTLSMDGDPLDVLLVVTNDIIQVGTVILCRPIGILDMCDESGIDNKVVAVPHRNISNEYNNVQDIDDISFYLKNQISYFFEHYKDLEKNKWVKINGWNNVNSAKTEIIQSIIRYDKNKKIYYDN